MDKWEYEIRYESPMLTSNRQTKEVRMNEMGDEGWELVAWVDGSQLNVSYAIYKRLKEVGVRQECIDLLNFMKRQGFLWNVDKVSTPAEHIYHLFKGKP